MSRETARYWQHPGLPGVDLLRARFVRQRYAKHTHETYVIAIIGSGVEEFHHKDTILRAGPGEVILLNPDTVHTGHAGAPGGWTFRVFYPLPEVIGSVAAELGGMPFFPQPVVCDPASSRLLTAAHRAAEGGDQLGASSLLHTAVAALLRRHAAHCPERLPRRTSRRGVQAAREILDGRLADPPQLAALARAVGASPNALARAFRAETGLPPRPPGPRLARPWGVARRCRGPGGFRRPGPPDPPLQADRGCATRRLPARALERSRRRRRGCLTSAACHDRSGRGRPAALARPCQASLRVKVARPRLGR